jgi:CheY-like chemotaxis protein
VEAANGRRRSIACTNEPFDIVLLDVHMPVMDGKEAIRRIRTSGQPWKDIPVIALTADAMRQAIARSILPLAWDDYVSKPLERQREADCHAAQIAANSRAC